MTIMQKNQRKPTKRSNAKPKKLSALEVIGFMLWTVLYSTIFSVGLFTILTACIFPDKVKEFFDYRREYRLVLPVVVQDSTTTIKAY